MTWCRTNDCKEQVKQEARALKAMEPACKCMFHFNNARSSPYDAKCRQTTEIQYASKTMKRPVHSARPPLRCKLLWDYGGKTQSDYAARIIVGCNTPKIAAVNHIGTAITQKIIVFQMKMLPKLHMPWHSKRHPCPGFVAWYANSAPNSAPAKEKRHLTGPTMQVTIQTCELLLLLGSARLHQSSYIEVFRLNFPGSWFYEFSVRLVASKIAIVLLTCWCTI